MRKVSKKHSYIKALIVAAILIGVLIYLLWSSPISANAAFIGLPDASNFGDVPNPEGADAVEKTGNLIASLMGPVRVIMGAVGIALIVLYGFTFVISGRNEETVTKQKRALTWGIIGLALISIAASLSEVFNFSDGSFLGSEESIIERAGIFDERATLIITFLKYILGSIAVFTIVRSGMVMIMAGGSEENITREKKNLIGGFVAIFFVIIGDFVVKKVLFKVTPDTGDNMAIVSIDAKAGVAEIVAITNLMVAFVGPLMILGMVGGGLMYAMAGGDEEKAGKAKKILVNSVLGALLIYGAFAIVTTIISGQI